MTLEDSIHAFRLRVMTRAQELVIIVVASLLDGEEGVGILIEVCQDLPSEDSGLRILFRYHPGKGLARLDHVTLEIVHGFWDVLESPDLK